MVRQGQRVWLIDAGNGDVFVHASGVLFGLQLEEGDGVTFDVTPDQKSGRIDV